MSNLPELPEVEENEIRVILSGGVVQGFIHGGGIDMQKISLTLIDYDVSGCSANESDNFCKDADGQMLEFRNI